MGLEMSGFLKGLFPFALAGALFLGIGAGRKSTYNENSARVQSAPITASLSQDIGGAVSSENKTRETLENKVKTEQTKANYMPNPKYARDDNFAGDTEQMILARALFGEARKQVDKYPDYVYGSARTIITRANRTGKSIKDTVLENNKITWQYTCFNPNDSNFEKLMDPINCGEASKDKEESRKEMKKIWERCYELAGQALEGKLQGREDLTNVTNYFVGFRQPLPGKYESSKAAKVRGIPYWAWERDKKGNLLKDKEGYLVPRNPVAQINLGKAGTAFFYNFKNF